MQTIKFHWEFYMNSAPAYSRYFAYGSNLSFAQMKKRCPYNLKIGIGILEGYRWIISKRGYANVVKSQHDYVLGEVYKITEYDESRLDVREGVDEKSYEKPKLEIFVDDIAYDCLVYVDPITEEGTPDEGYASTINEGIKDSNLPQEYVEKYIREKIPSLQC